MPEFLVPGGTDLAELAARLVASGGLDRGTSSTLERTFYDTFDWRLWRAGTTLVAERCGRRLLLRLEPREREATPVRGRARAAPAPASVEIPARPRRLTTRTAEAPRFTWELPRGALRRCLEPIVEMRALLPQATVRTSSQQLGQRDEHDKLLLRLSLEQHELLEPDGARTAGARLRLCPLRGYAKAARLARVRLEHELGFVAASEELLPSLLRLLGREIADYTAKLELELEPTMPAAEAMRIVLAALCRTMLANLEGMLDDVDSEFLHDFRVAVRRTRTALARMRAVLPMGSARRFRAGFRWLGQLTGGARDLDVYLLHFDQYRDLLPEPLHEPFELLRGFLGEKRSEHRRELGLGIASARGRTLLAQWSELVSEPAAERGQVAHARRPIAQVAREQLWRIYRKTIALGQGIHDGSAPGELHELRKSCKKLRYLIEFFQSLLPAEDIGRLLEELKGLQQILGEVQDLEVQTATLMRYSAEMSSERQVPPATLMAVGALVEQLRQRQLGARQQFATAFGRFSRPELRQLARDSLKPVRAGDRRTLGARRRGAR